MTSAQVVSMVKLVEWINSVSYTPMLRYSLLAPLLSEYFPDGVGISPTTIRHSGATRVRGEGEAAEKGEARQVGEKSAAGEGGGGMQAGERGTESAEERREEGEAKKEEDRKAGEKRVGNGETIPPTVLLC